MAQYGVPERIRTDNGTPFSSISGLGISRLSIKWMQLGIIHERIEPGRPTQNGRHERMHKTLKDAATPPAQNLKAQKQRYMEFTKVFNHERPHEALAMNTLPRSIRQARNGSRQQSQPSAMTADMWSVPCVETEQFDGKTARSS
jgi:transposase InsO family protein